MTSGLNFAGETAMFRTILLALALVAMTLTGISITTIGMSSLEPVQAFDLPG